MYTSVGLFALAAALQSAQPAESLWLRDYGTGQAQAAREQKPLVVVVGTGAEGFEKLAQEGKLGDEVHGLLAEHYVCVYLDRDQATKAKLVGDLSIATGQGLIISVRKGEVMAFHHDGTLSLADLQTHLRTFANPALEVRTTQTHGAARYSYYPSTGFSGSGYSPYVPAARPVNC